MKKHLLDLTVTGVERLTDRHVLIRLTHEELLPEALPGQFVEVRIDEEPSVFLRRPISINHIDRERNELWLLVATIGKGTRRLGGLQVGDKLNCLLPLGNSFKVADEAALAPGRQVLLVGGGVGMAPMYFLGKALREKGVQPTFLLGARTASEVLLIDRFRELGEVCVTTEDGSMGEQGFVTNHSVLARPPFCANYSEADGARPYVACCGPKPMMVAVARWAKAHGIECEVSLENMMACGLGACLCCVEKTVEGNLCVCKEGPVFNIKKLLWQN